MEILDLFKDWTLKDLSYLKDGRKTKECRGKISQALAGRPKSKEHIRHISEVLTGRKVSWTTRQKISKTLLAGYAEGRLTKTNIGKPRDKWTKTKISEAQKKTWSNRTSEEKGKIGKKISEAQKRSYANRLPKELEDTSKKQSESRRRYLLGRTLEEVENYSKRRSEGWARKSLKEMKEFGKTRSEAQQKVWAKLTIEERKEIRRNISKGSRKHLAGLSKEAMDKRMRNSFLSDEAVKRSATSNRTSPSMPEWFVGYWVESNHSGDWAYTGDRKSMPLLRSRGYTGLKVPDFININGKKIVIEILGGLGYWHTEDEAEQKIKYYKNYGFDCLVLFEEDCYDYKRLETKYQRLIRGES